MISTGTLSRKRAVISRMRWRACPIAWSNTSAGAKIRDVAALPLQIATLRAEGYTFVTVAQLLGLKPIYR
jgi:hypothetical protein